MTVSSLVLYTHAHIPCSRDCCRADHRRCAVQTTIEEAKASVSLAAIIKQSSIHESTCQSFSRSKTAGWESRFQGCDSVVIVVVVVIVLDLPWPTTPYFRHHHQHLTLFKKRRNRETLLSTAAAVQAKPPALSLPALDDPRDISIYSSRLIDR